MNDYKASSVGIDDDMIYQNNFPDWILPSYHYRFYIHGLVVYICRDKDDLFRVVGNFRPNSNYYTFNSREVEIYRWRKYWCFCCDKNFFQAKRCFYIYCKKMIDIEIDKMFNLQPALDGILD